MEGQISIFDILSTEKFDVIKTYALRGSGSVGGKERIKDFFSKNLSKKERTDYLKKEYGVGGYGSPHKEPCYIHEIMHDASGNRIEYYDENTQSHEIIVSYSDLEDKIEKLIACGEY